ncbi:MAG: Nramp family divalent metal transporter [Thiomonas sp.]|uniref:Nramp family divalent metal transporter n=1 Tax=Thiomonas sp. TaxID=2047785 RepID=UPI002A36D9A4|nr:Nramp family divalent metal transporter [Thiomonas sp.]MDY0331182.1 Nramp family divalent metal transporter [Thiomonas sp.]
MSYASTLDQRTAQAAHIALSGARGGRGLWRTLPFIGPAVVASVAYVDPGNFATNIQAGAQHGYTLLWVVLWANLAAILVQGLSAKLGIATGRNLPELIRERFPRKLVWFYWVQAEIVAMMTDLAEFLGAALALHLLFGLPMGVAVLAAFVVVMGILTLERRGFRPLELVVAALVGVIALGYGLQLVLSRPALLPIFEGMLTPGFGGSADAVYLAVGILGATVMPHVIYLHSSLTQRRIQVPPERRALLMRFAWKDVVLAMGLAGLINMAMLAVAAATFHQQGRAAGDLSEAYRTLMPMLGAGAATAFALALLASGISSSVVGTMAGQVVMQGLVGFTVPLWVRRLVTSLPAVIVVMLGVDPTSTLVFSQVVLSFGIPFALVPLLLFTSNRGLMGELVNRPAVRWVGWAVTALIIALNALLLWKLV